jgi:hypothetical protein
MSATNIGRMATVQNGHDGLVDLAAGISEALTVILITTANPLTS